MVDQVAAPPLPFTQTDALRASFEFGFNCGPAALAALLGLTPAEIRPHLGDFRGHMNTAAVQACLGSLGRSASARPLCGPRATSSFFPDFGIVRVQWGGSWLRPGVHPGAAAARTHWIASRLWGGLLWIYDVNSGWTSKQEWAHETVPKIIADVKGCDGTWFFPNCIDVDVRA